MPSNIDDLKPVSGTALTANVRANFGYAEDEINQLFYANQDMVTAGGTANAITATYAVAATLQTNRIYGFVSASDNTGATTFNPSATGAKALNVRGTALSGGEILSGGTYFAKYDGTDFDLLNPEPDTGGIATNSAAIEQLETGTINLVSAGGAANALTANFTTDLVLSDGARCLVKATADITSVTPTLSTDGNTARTITRSDGGELHIGDIVSGQYCEFVYASSGPTWLLMNPSQTGSMVLLDTQTASSDASIDFTSHIDDKYDKYVIDIINVVPVTDSVDLHFRTGAGSFDSGASDYSWTSLRHQVNSAVVSNTSDSEIQVIGVSQISNTASAGGISGKIQIYGPSDSSHYTKIDYLVNYALNSNDASTEVTGSGQRQAAQADDRIRIQFSSNNILSGTCKLYGLR